MGSYCSVLNNQNDIIYIKYSANSDGLLWGGIVFALLSIELPFDSAIVDLVDEGIITQEVVNGVSVVIGLSSLGFDIPAFIDKATAKMNTDGYTCIRQGQSYKSEKMSLSLVMQANCLKLVQSDSETIDIYNATQTVWTGPTNNSVNNYNSSDFSWKKVGQFKFTSTNNNPIYFKNFTKSSKNINLTQNHILNAQCNDCVKYDNSTVDLDNLIGNDNGNLVIGAKFSESSKDITLKNNNILCAQCRKLDGSWKYSECDLNCIIGNKFGKLVTIKDYTNDPNKLIHDLNLKFQLQ